MNSQRLEIQALTDLLAIRSVERERAELNLHSANQNLKALQNKGARLEEDLKIGLAAWKQAQSGPRLNLGLTSAWASKALADQARKDSCKDEIQAAILFKDELQTAWSLARARAEIIQKRLDHCQRRCRKLREEALAQRMADRATLDSWEAKA